MSTESLRVAVVGGGVCGLTCAVALQRRGVDVQVYEAAVCTTVLGLTSVLTVPFISGPIRRDRGWR